MSNATYPIKPRWPPGLYSWKRHHLIGKGNPIKNRTLSSDRPKFIIGNRIPIKLRIFGKYRSRVKAAKKSISAINMFT